MRYKYLLSLPERAIRSLAALTGGLIREIGDIALPAALRRTMLYRTMVGITLRFLIEQVGQVEGTYPVADPAGGLAENFLLQRTASHGIELLGILAFHASPIWVLAALADVTASGQKLLSRIAETLQEEGLLEAGYRFETMEQVLNGLEKSSAHLALAINMPPLDVASLRREWETLRIELAQIPPSRIPALDTLDKSWDDLRASAKAQNRTLLAMSSLVAISTLAHVPSNVVWLSKAAHAAARRTTGMVGGALLDHYTAALTEIAQTGFVPYWKREFRPYLHAAAEQFNRDRQSSTERALG